MRKVGAILLFILSGLLLIGFLSQLINVFAAIVALFSGKLNAYQFGEVTGIIIFQIVLLILIMFLAKKGRKILKNNQES
ncbi:MAG: hypothetical protein BalsKO_27680 [Balneolaceae bacterium]